MATASEPTEEIKQRIELIGLERAREEIDAGTKLIDVREQNEWDESHLEAAIHVPQGELVERIDELAPDRSERLLLHCRTDNRSARDGRRRSQGLGYDNVAVIEGGIVAWEDAGLPTVSDSGPDHGAADALLAPHAAARGRGRGPAQAARLEGAAARRRRARRADARSTSPRPGSARSGSSTTTSSTSRTCSAR